MLVPFRLLSAWAWLTVLFIRVLVMLSLFVLVLHLPKLAFGLLRLRACGVIPPRVPSILLVVMLAVFFLRLERLPGRICAFCDVLLLSFMPCLRLSALPVSALPPGIARVPDIGWQSVDTMS